MFSAFLTWCRISALIAGLLLAGHAAAQLPAADEQAIRGVVLNDELLDTLIAIRTETSIADSSEGDDADPAALRSVDGMVRAAIQVPGVQEILNKHGISARDYVITSIALLRAGMAAQFDSTAAPEAHGTSAANIAFVRSRMDKVQRVFSDPEEEDEDY